MRFDETQKHHNFISKLLILFAKLVTIQHKSWLGVPQHLTVHKGQAQKGFADKQLGFSLLVWQSIARQHVCIQGCVVEIVATIFCTFALCLRLCHES